MIALTLSVFCTQMLLLSLSSVKASCDFPNNTATMIHWWPCSSGSIEFSKFAFQDVNGTEEYPLNLSKSLMLTAELTNNGKTFTKIKNNIDIWLFSGWLSCSWINLPTFGLLHNRDACSAGVPCPIRPGRQRLTVPLDFANYTVITKLLKNDAPYQIRYAIVDEDTGESNCVYMQIRIKSS